MSTLNLPLDECRAKTEESLNNLHVGQKYSELFSFSVIVLDINDFYGVLALAINGGGCYLMKFNSKEDFKSYCSYGNIKGFWLEYFGDVSEETKNKYITLAKQMIKDNPDFTLRESVIARNLFYQESRFFS